MPRLLVEYSANLKNYFDPQELLKELVKQASLVPTVNPSLIKARLWQPETAWIPSNLGDIGSDRGYIFTLFEWLEGRSDEHKLALRMGLEQTLHAFKLKIQKNVPVSMTLEIREIRRNDHIEI